MILKIRLEIRKYIIGKSALTTSSYLHYFGIYHYTQGKDKYHTLHVVLQDFLRICPTGTSININLGDIWFNREELNEMEWNQIPEDMSF